MSGAEGENGEGRKPFSLTVATALVSLFGSLLGNYFQYKTIGQKDTELALSQAKISTDASATLDRKFALEQQQRELQSRMTILDAKLKTVEEQNSAAYTGLAYAHTSGDRIFGEAEIRESVAAHKELLTEKKTLQDKIDVLALVVASCSSK